MDAARGHALVGRLDDDADAFRIQHVPDAVGDLRRHLFLDLEAPRKGLHDPREFADADDLVVRQIAHVRAPDDRRHVVFAVRLETDITQHDHLVVTVDFLESALQVLDRILLVAAEPVLVGRHDALRRVQQAFPARVIARPEQQGPDGFFGLLAARLARFSGLLVFFGQGGVLVA